MSDEEREGNRVGPYLLGECIGEGAMAKVYEAQDTRTGETVALKLLRSVHAGRSEAVARFVREGRAMARTKHPRVVVVHEHGSTDDYLYIAMERLKGRTLDALIRESGPLPLERALPIALHLAEALEHVHRNGMVHRDLKPENVMVLEAGTPTEHAKLLDFGLARMSQQDIGEGSIQYTTVGQLVGSAAFMSPEQARGAPVEATADVYAFGTVVYEMITGKLPYSSQTLNQMLAARQKSDPIPINQRVRGIKVPEDVASLIGTCLARDIARRPPDGADLLTRLRTCAHRLEDAASEAPTRLLVVGEEVDGASSRLKAGSDRGQLSTGCRSDRDCGIVGISVGWRGFRPT